MATQKTTVVVDVVDNGSTEKLNQQAQKTHKSFKELAKTAGSIVAGGAKQALSLATSKPAAGSSAIMNEMQYGAARGSAGLTGASARDFARQAEGLNGLVRLYATYAANIYAVGAAFTALSRAMDTANMVDGLNQLGASSGVALGSLSKRLVEATDGAIALREAMEATVKASSSGMDSTQILRMGRAAKLASQALGVDMNDAVSRITRGITKLEPELLDELGLFIKVDDVVKNYAQSVGKAASSVTDFEKRQAVANAVLTQAEEKFSAINIDTNPYTKLAATMKDLAQAGLELVNKVLAPIAGYLAESPTALAVGMAAFVGLIVKQAIPAITQYRESVLASTEEAVKASAEKYSVAKKYLNLETAQLKAVADREAEESHNRFEEASNRILKSYQNSAGKTKGLSKEVAAIAAKNAADISAADLKVIDSYANAGTKRSQVYKDFADSIREYKTLAETSESEIAKIEAKRLADSEALNKSFAESNKRSLQDMYSSNIRAQAAYTASTKGFVAALKEAVDMQRKLKNGTAEVTFEMEELDSSGKRVTKTITEKIPATTKLGAAFAGLSGIFAATASTVGGLISRLGAVGEAVGIAIAVGGLMYAWLTNTSKQSAETGKSIDILDSSLSNVSKTLETIAKKPTQLRFDTQSISAAATAVSDLGTQLVDTFEKSYAEIDAMNWADKLVDAVMPGSVEGRLAERVASSVDAAFKAVDADSPAAKKARESIQSALRLDPKAVLNAMSIEKALDGLSESQRKNAIEAVSNSIKTLGKEMQISAARGAELLAGFKKLDDSRQKLFTSFVPKDEFAQYGQDLVDTSVKLGNALADPVQKYNALVQLAAEYPKVSGATAGTAILLQDLATDVAALNNASARYAASQQKLSQVEAELNNLIGKERAKAVLEGRKVQISGLTSAGVEELNKLRASIKALREESKAASDIKLQVQLRIEQAQEVVSKAQLDVFKSGAELVSSSLSAEWAKAGSTIANAYASILSGTETGIKLRAESEKAVINAQIAQIQSQRNLMISNQRLAIAVERETLERMKQSGDALDRQYVIGPREAALNAREADLAQVESGKSTKGMYKDLADELSKGTRQMTGLDTASLSFARNMEASGSSIANLSAQIAAIDISAKDQILAEQYKKRKESLESQNKLLAEQKVSLDAIKTGMGVYNEAYILEKQRIETKQKELSQAAELLSIEAEIARYKQPGVAEKAGPEIKRAEAKKAELVATQQLQSLNLRITQAQERALGAIDATAEARKKQVEQDSKQRQVLADSLASRSTLLDLGREVGAYTEKEYLIQKYVLDVEKARADYAEKLASTRESSAVKLDELSKREATIQAAMRASNRAYTAAEITELAKIAEARATINTTQKQAETSANTVLQSNLTNLEVLKQVNVQQAEWNQRLETVKGIGEAIKGVFEGIGETFATGLNALVTALSETAALADKNTAAIERFGKAGDEAFNKAMSASTVEESLKYSEEATEAWKAQDKVRAKAQKDEISGYAKTVGAAKSMFKEKTAAHKILATTEKALHIARIAMDMKEMVTKLFTDQAETASKVTAESAQTGATMAGTLARIPAYITEIYGKTIGQLGPIAGPVVATSLIALMLSAMGGKGGSAGSAKALAGNEGTGTVFGDKEAKSESLTRSLDRGKDVDVITMRNTGDMVRHLRNIDENIGQLGVTILRSLGVSDDIAEGKFGIQVGKFDSAVGRLVAQIPVIGTFLSGVVKALGFGTSVKVKGQGITAGAQTLGGITTRGFEGGYYSVVEKKNKAFGITYDSSTKRRVTALEDEVSLQFTRVFEGIYGAVNSAAQALGRNMSDVNYKLNTYIVKLGDINLNGLKPEEQLEKLKNVFGAEADKIAQAAVPGLEEFVRVGEGYSETIFRVAQDTESATVALEMIGVKAVSYSNILNKQGDVSAEIVRQSLLNVETQGFIVDVLKKANGTGQDLIDTYKQLDSVRDVLVQFGVSQNYLSRETVIAAGGLDKLADSVSNFFDKFASETTKSNINTKQVTTTFSDLGLAIPKTRQELYKLVTTLTSTAPEAAAGLMGITDALDQYYARLEKLKTSDVTLRTVFDSLYKTDLQSKVNKITDSLAELAGGLDTFLERANFYMQNFLTQEEQLAAVSEGVARQLDKLAAMGYQAADGVVDTREEFKALVSGLNLTTRSGQEAYTILMEIASGFDQMLKPGEAAAARIKSERENLEAKLKEVKLTGNIAALRALELEKLDETNRSLQIRIWYEQDLIDLRKKRQELENRILTIEKKTNQIRLNELAQLDRSLISLQVRIYTMEDEASLLQQLETARNNESNAIKSTISNIKQAITSLREYKSSLLLSDISTLTPEQQYQQARIDLDKLIKQISKTPTTAAEKSAQLEAVGQFESVSQKFLSISRSVNASSAAYTADFNKVLEVLDYTATNVLETSLSNEELQLKELEASTAFLGSIEEKTETVADILTKLYQAYVTGLATTSKDSEFYYSKIFKGITGVSDTVLTYAQTKQALAGLATDKNVDTLIRGADKNADGIINSVEGAALAQTLNIIRSVADGAAILNGSLTDLEKITLTYVQVKTALTGLATDGNLNALIRDADRNADGIISGIEKAALYQTIRTIGSVSSGVAILNGSLTDLEKVTLTYAQVKTALIGLATDGNLNTLIREADVNADGIISGIEKAALYQTIQTIGSVSSGAAALKGSLASLQAVTLTYAQVQAALAGKATDAQLAKVITEADADNNLLISRTELADINTRLAITGKLSSLENLVLTYEEIRAALAGKATDAQLNQVIREADADNNLLISRTELADINTRLAITGKLSSLENLVLTYEEIRAALVGTATDAKLDQVIREADVDNNLLISRTELASVANSLAVGKSVDSSLAKSGATTAGSVNTLTNTISGQNSAIISNTASTANTSASTAQASAESAATQAWSLEALAIINNDTLTTVADNVSAVYSGLLTVNTNLSWVVSYTSSSAEYLRQIRDSNEKMLSGSATTTSAAASSKSGTTIFSKVTKAVTSVVKGATSVVNSAVKTVGKILGSIFSDERLKKNITHSATLSNGINLYDFEYKNPKYGIGKKRGVLAQEVMQDYPGAVSVDKTSGMYMVDYNKLPIPSSMLRFAKGGLAPTGTHIVGELGPEIVDFNTPGRVYTAEQTFGMFNGASNDINAELVREIQQLRKEVINLQKQQQEQTGHLINATYDSQDRNAEQVSDAVVSTAANQEWMAKVRSKAQLV